MKKKQFKIVEFIQTIIQICTTNGLKMSQHTEKLLFELIFFLLTIACDDNKYITFNCSFTAHKRLKVYARNAREKKYIS